MTILTQTKRFLKQDIKTKSAILIVGILIGGILASGLWVQKSSDDLATANHSAAISLAKANKEISDYQTKNGIPLDNKVSGPAEDTASSAGPRPCSQFGQTIAWVFAGKYCDAIVAGGNQHHWLAPKEGQSTFTVCNYGFKTVAITSEDEYCQWIRDDFARGELS